MRKKESVEGMHANVFLHRRWSKKGRERVYIMENKVSSKREKKELNNNNKKKTDIQNKKALQSPLNVR